ncbi:YbaN family protein [Roseovarius sp. SCSIO 43702]|uniref:YbaN family protein n=1 Tax=Roseovarius sp. SCSIO 43702 TaxID=2823043 RepID=UPI001C72AAE6|nr:YbaN family protein [Roseovarius sp. SCSIO 43702]QYX56999.1 YbaN family protein [Roseovarius sp. SCSIO 43702]
MRALWLILGLICLILGGAGVILPLVPTVPFLLLAAYCFARSSGRLHMWLLSHPRLGPPIRDWQSYGAIRRRAKYLATASIAGVLAISLLLGLKSQIIAIQIVVLTCVLVFIWSRPEGPR